MRRSPGDTCGVCVYFEFVLTVRGCCRRNSPRAGTVIGTDRDVARAQWPMVLPDSDWCGEFERAPQAGRPIPSPQEGQLRPDPTRPTTIGGAA